MKARYLFPDDYMADLSVHVFNGRLYISPSHDIETGAVFDDDGGHFQMRDYHVLSLSGSPLEAHVTDHGVFHLGVAISERPEGPFIPQEHPIRSSFSIDPCVFKDDDGEIYCYFGGLWGGQLQWCSQPKAPSKSPLRGVRGGFSWSLPRQEDATLLSG